MVSASATVTLRLTIVRAEELKNVQTLGQQDPFVEGVMLPWNEACKTKAASGASPIWQAKHDNILEFKYYGKPVPPEKALLQLRVMDQEALRDARLIGEADPLDVGKIMMKSDASQDLEIPLFDAKRNPAGRLFCTFQVVLKGMIEVTVRSGRVRNLGQRMTAQENYVSGSLLHHPEPEAEEDPKPVKESTKIAKGLTPVWKKENVLVFHLDGQSEPRLLLEVMDKEYLGKDREVGRGAIALTTGARPIITYRTRPTTVAHVNVDLVDPHFLPAGRLQVDVRFINFAFDESKQIVRGISMAGVRTAVKMKNGHFEINKVDLTRELRIVWISLEEELVNTAPLFLKDIAKKMNVSAGILSVAFWGSVVFSGTFIFFLFGARLLMLLVGILYPSYMSFKAVESAGKDDDTQWLIYWICFGALETLEYTVFALLKAFNPLYGGITYIISMGVLLYLQSPTTRGAEKLYREMIAPLLRKHEQEIDRRISKARDKIDEIDEVLRLPEERRSSKRMSKRISQKIE